MSVSIQSLPALVWEGGMSVAVRPVPTPEPAEGFALLDVAFSGLCGTDLHICAGEHSRAQPGIVIGHELVGTLAEPAGVLAAGQAVFANPMMHCGTCDACTRGLVHVCERLRSVGIDRPGAACPRVLVPAGGLYALPDGVALADAALVEPLAVCVRAVRRSALEVGERAHVIGGGPIGCLLALLATDAGASEVSLSEPSATRRALAEGLGIATVDPERPEPVADVVFDATGVPTVAASLGRWARVGGRVVVVGAYPPAPVPVDLLRVMFAELSLVGTRIYTKDDIIAAIAIVASGRLGLSRLVSEIVPLGEGVRAIETLRAGTALKLLLKP
ncbi:MAG: zinc-dependent alcohol dehydrogenase [Acidimicrobiales bacterium]